MQNRKFDAVIFDLDGVITKTALVHSAAWKKMFDDFLMDYAGRHHVEFKEFTHKDDYLPFVDGKPRYKGVADFLSSRGIDLPFGDPSDAPSMESVCGLGNLKNDAFNEVLRRDGVEVYPSTVALMKELREKGYRVGVASSSKNCEAVLAAAGLLSLVETRVDGVVSAEMGLKGKPEADIFTTAAANLGCDPCRSVVVEDAVSGVQAGRNGSFGLVLGIAREENKAELLLNGADIVVEDIEETSISAIDEWFENGLVNDSWSISYMDYDPKKERSREALLAVGNGYFGTRGAMEESNANKVNYPGTYLAGLYNRLITKVADRDVENEDFVNIPNWLAITFKIDDGEWMDVNSMKIVSIERNIRFDKGLLVRKLVVEDKQGRQTSIRSERFASMDNPLLAAMRYSIQPLNYSGTITLRSGIDGALINDGVERYKSLNQQHMKSLKTGAEQGVIFVLNQTTQSKYHIAEAALHHIFLDGKPMAGEAKYAAKDGRAWIEQSAQLNANQCFATEKIVAICSDKEDFVEDALASSLSAINSKMTFDELLAESVAKWKELWNKFDIRISGDRMSQKLLRLHIYHLLTSVSPVNEKLDASITARGLHGEAYRGHIFWDELFILPLYDLHLPQVAKSMLMYRYRRLQKAKEYAAAHGFAGAMFPWQSGSDGREETQVLHLNPLTGEWGDDHSSLQRHVSLAIAYNIWDYYWITADKEFMAKFGAEMFFEICRFWASKAKLNNESNRYEISGVMGPDEFHEHMPHSEEGGLKDNTYTNLMVAWMFGKALEINKLVGVTQSAKLGFDSTEFEKWEDIASRLSVVINEEGILAQYDGYFELAELDWDYYRTKYGNVYRMDRILKAEGKSPDAYKVAKQADTLMTFYNLDKHEVDSLLSNLGYTLPQDYLQRNLRYYLGRTSHGSTLSRVVHARLAAMVGDKALSNELYQDALGSDYIDIQGGTTGEGIHAGVMAGTVLIVLNTFAGVNFRGDLLTINPDLPENWKNLAFKLTFKGVDYAFEINSVGCKVLANKDCSLMVGNKMVNLVANNEHSLKFA